MCCLQGDSTPDDTSGTVIYLFDCTKGLHGWTIHLTPVLTRKHGLAPTLTLQQRLAPTAQLKYAHPAPASRHQREQVVIVRYTQNHVLLYALMMILADRRKSADEHQELTVHFLGDLDGFDLDFEPIS